MVSAFPIMFIRSLSSIYPGMSASFPSAFITVPGVHNFRDASGCSAHGPDKGALLRKRYLFRSGHLSSITPKGRDKINQLGVKFLFDLRSPQEVHKDKNYDISIPGTTRVHAPVFQSGAHSPEEIALHFRPYLSGGAEGFVEAYVRILDKGVSAYSKVFSHVLNCRSDPFLVYCTAGKDRTGVLVALILSIAGVKDEDIAQEYSLTEIGLSEWKRSAVKHVQNILPTPVEDEKVEGMLSAKYVPPFRPENMLATLNAVRERYGGAEGYLMKRCGFTRSDVEAIRHNLIQ